MPEGNTGTRIPPIQRLPLPMGLPTPEAIKSWGQNEVNYDPDFWDLEYTTYRYLSGMRDDALRDRYDCIVRNMRSWTGPERDVVPIVSYQGSWWWFRKEHQTRLEFAFRDLEPPAHIYEPPVPCTSGPVHPAIPNGTKLIYRYSNREYVRQMVEEGRVRFSAAQSYEGEENNAAQRDEELSKHAYMPGRYTKITTQDGQPIEIIGDVQRTVSASGYHLVCFSCVWDPQLFEDFQADTCVVVTDPAEFARRLEAAGAAVFPGWYSIDCPVQYFDPYERRKKEYFEAGMSKDFRFAYQNEYRILWSQLNNRPIDGAHFVDIGPAHEIMRMYDASGEEISE
ncbi:MAG: hypothetical protein ACFCVH_03670 [Alphaproteobacteria bacterium]